MDQLKPHPFEAEVDRVIMDLHGDLSKVKEVFDTGTMYRAEFDGAPLYVCLPTYIPTRASNVLRIEFVIGEIDKKDVGRLLLSISLDMDTHRHFALRVIPRVKDQHTYQIILQSVCEVDLVRDGFVASTILYAADLFGFYREEFLGQKETA